MTFTSKYDTQSTNAELKLILKETSQIFTDQISPHLNSAHFYNWQQTLPAGANISIAKMEETEEDEEESGSSSFASSSS